MVVGAVVVRCVEWCLVLIVLFSLFCVLCSFFLFQLVPYHVAERRDVCFVLLVTTLSWSLVLPRLGTEGVFLTRVPDVRVGVCVSSVWWLEERGQVVVGWWRRGGWVKGEGKKGGEVGGKEREGGR